MFIIIINTSMRHRHLVYRPLILNLKPRPHPHSRKCDIQSPQHARFIDDGGIITINKPPAGPILPHAHPTVFETRGPSTTPAPHHAARLDAASLLADGELIRHHHGAEEAAARATDPGAGLVAAVHQAILQEIGAAVG